MAGNLQDALLDSAVAPTKPMDLAKVGVESKAPKSLFCLWYRERRNPHPQTKYFFFEGDLRAAIAKGRQHCETTNLVFIHVRPFLSDLEADEKRHLGNFD